jgi:anti-sigma B factor antagonist
MNEETDKLKIQSRRAAGEIILELSGEIDLRTSPGLRASCLELLDEKIARIVLDLTGVSYIDSSGVGTIVELKRKAMRNKSKVILVGLQPRVRSLFEITRLDKFFDIAATIDEARKL